VITAAYIMLVIRRVFFGEMPAEFEGHITALRAFDKIAIVLMCLLIVVIGLFPVVLVPLVQTGVDNVLRILGGA